MNFRKRDYLLATIGKLHVDLNTLGISEAIEMK